MFNGRWYKYIGHLLNLLRLSAQAHHLTTTDLVAPHVSSQTWMVLPHSNPDDESCNIPSTKVLPVCCFVNYTRSNSVEGKQNSSQTVSLGQCHVVCLFLPVVFPHTHTHTHTHRFPSPLETHQIATTVVINLCHKPYTSKLAAGLKSPRVFDEVFEVPGSLHRGKHWIFEGLHHGATVCR